MTPSFSSTIQDWYSKNRRDLPWRHTKDPYKIWLSEIILQQTRVAQGLPYYTKLIEHFPTIGDLAAANEDDVLRLWQGLGYYSRGRNLLKCAQVVVNEYNCQFPKTASELQKLPGVGPYTAAAIASFAFGEAEPVVDGNVYRVISRYLNIDFPIDDSKARKTYTTIAGELLDANRPDTHNQAIMEFGALVCTPQQADCTNCPVNESCQALANDTVYQRPVKNGKQKKRIRHFNYVIVLSPNERTMLEKRGSKDIWQGLHQFPLIETSVPEIEMDEVAEFAANITPGFTRLVRLGETKHILSHQVILCTFWLVLGNEFQIPPKSDIFEVNLNEVGTVYPVPVLISKLMENYDLRSYVN